MADIHIRQSLYTTYGTIDLTISDDALVELGRDVRAHTGMKSTAVLLWDKTVPVSALEEAERSLTSAGFTLERVALEQILSTSASSEYPSPERISPEPPSSEDTTPEAKSPLTKTASSSLATFVRLATLLAEKNITSSDALVVIGAGELLNCALAVASSYARKLPGPITCALVPTTYDSLLLTSAYPASLPLLENRQRDNRQSNSVSQLFSCFQGPSLSFVGSPSFIATTPNLLQAASKHENLLLAQTLMVKGAFLDSQNTWEAFLKNIDELAMVSKELQDTTIKTIAGSTELSSDSPSAESITAISPEGSEGPGIALYFDALGCAAKSLALVEHAQTVQVRSTSAYGDLFATAFIALDSSITRAQALAEGMRLSADLGVALHDMPLDYAIEQSAALETLGLPEAKALVAENGVTEDTFLAEVKRIARQTSRSLQAVVPTAPGKLARAPFSDELLKTIYQKRFGV